MQGVLLIDKPSGWTSFDVVNYVRKMVATAEGKKPKHTKVGHTGTLDPLATGLLVLLIGKEYTRRAQELTKLDKTYAVTMKLGETSTTADDEGDKTVISNKVPDAQAIQAALRRYTGDIQQVPPAFSAMKINGQRAYKLAREGKSVELDARPVTVYETELTAYDYPFVRFIARVSSGTYIRALVTDLGTELATGAYMSDLRRTTVGNYKIEQAIGPQGLTIEEVSARAFDI